jgi:GNAT superfamily N-acetyltransferase
MQDLVIRRANADDAPAACALVRRSIAELCGEDHYDDPAMVASWLENKTPANFATWIDSADNVPLVAQENGNLRGFALLNRGGRVLLLYVAPEARFRGVSKALLSALEGEAVELGLREVHLASTATALRFYKGHGYITDCPPGARAGRSPSHPLKKTL